MKLWKEVSTYYLIAALLPIGLNFIQDEWMFRNFPDSALSGLRYVPWIALPVLGFLGWRLNQSRVLFVALALLLVFHLLYDMDTRAVGQIDRSLAMGTSLSLPLGLSLVLIMKESPLWSQESLLRLLLMLLPGFLLFGLSKEMPGIYGQMTAWNAFNDPVFHLPHATFIVLILFSLLAYFHRDQKLHPFLVAFIFALIPIFSAMDDSLNTSGRIHPVFNPGPHNMRILVLDYLISSGILLWAIFSMYWHRVYVDELTGVPNRRALDEKFPLLGNKYCLAMVDIDHFKKFNDTYGHDEGDNVLRYVARHLSDGSAGRAYRYGGEEFVLVFEGWTSTDTEKHVNEIRETLAARPFSIRLPQKIRKKTSPEDRGTMKARVVEAKLTVSMGVACPDKDHGDPRLVIKLADQGLYDAKGKGRNCVVRKN